MAKRRVFYSFHYVPDHWRAGQVRNMGKLDGNTPATDNDWEAVKRGGDRAIRKWIDDQMSYKSCVVILVGSNTANRKWINYEIEKAWELKKGIVAIHVNKLQDQHKQTSTKGLNPLAFGNTPGGNLLSGIAKCYTPTGSY